MAEAAFRQTAIDAGYADSFNHIDSCGTIGIHAGNRPDSRTVATLSANGIQTEHRSRQVTKKDFDVFDYVLAMDNANLSDLLQKAPPGSKAKVMLFGDFGANKGEEVADPYYGGQSGFDKNFEQVVSFSKGFLRQTLGATNV